MLKSAPFDPVLFQRILRTVAWEQLSVDQQRYHINRCSVSPTEKDYAIARAVMEAYRQHELAMLGQLHDIQIFFAIQGPIENGEPSDV